LAPEPGSTHAVDYSSFARDVHSQCGEDGIIEAILARLPEHDRWAVEFGAWDGISLSNTAALADRGYARILIESDRARFKALTERFAPEPKTKPIFAAVGWEGVDTLDVILNDTRVPRGFDVLSIDIDGNDYHVWKAIQVYRPKLVVVEFNPTIRNGVEYVQEPVVGLRRGASISSLVALGKAKGYELAATTEFNAIFVRSALYGHLDILDNSVESLRTDTSWQSEVFFGFDGNAIFRGGRGLEWHGVDLPEHKRMVPLIFSGFPGDMGLVRKAMLKVWQRWRRLKARFRRRG
jgi:hypothetical protein